MSGEVPMKLNPAHVDEFARLLQSCAGKVCLITTDGDRLIINSLLTSAIGLASIFTVAQSQEISVECEKPEDQKRFEKFAAFCRAAG